MRFGDSWSFSFSFLFFSPELKGSTYIANTHSGAFHSPQAPSRRYFIAVLANQSVFSQLDNTDSSFLASQNHCSYCTRERRVLSCKFDEKVRSRGLCDHGCRIVGSRSFIKTPNFSLRGWHRCNLVERSLLMRSYLIHFFSYDS